MLLYKKITKGIAIIGITNLLLTGCGNKDMFDSNKTFDFAIISSSDKESALVIGISAYTTYEGEQEQIQLDDDSVLLVSSFNTRLFRNEGNISAEEHARAYVGNEGEITTISKIERNGMNKDWIDTVYTFHKAIVLTNNTAIIYDIKQWKTYPEDDTIQLKLEDGSYILTGVSDTIIMKEGDKYKATDIAIGVLGSDAEIRTFDTKDGYKALTKKK